MVTKSISDKLRGQAPLERIVSTYPHPRKFYDEMSNYLVGGLVISCSKFFMMAKPVDSAKDPSGQWWIENPDCWYVRWVCGENSMRVMFDAVEPLPMIMFRRLKASGESGLKIWNWDRMYKRVCYG